MGKGSSRRVEDRARVAANWDAVFGPRITVSPTPQTEREVPAPGSLVFELSYPQLTQPEPGSFDRHMENRSHCPLSQVIPLSTLKAHQ